MTLCGHASHPRAAGRPHQRWMGKAGRVWGSRPRQRVSQGLSLLAVETTSLPDCAYAVCVCVQNCTPDSSVLVWPPGRGVWRTGRKFGFISHPQLAVGRQSLELSVRVRAAGVTALHLLTPGFPLESQSRPVMRADPICSPIFLQREFSQIATRCQ